MRKKATLVLALVFALSFFIPFLIFYIIVSKPGEPSKAENDSPKVAIVSVPPKTAVRGEYWQYGVTIRNYNRNLYSIIVQKPKWLLWDSYKMVLKGKVPDDISDFFIKIEVMDNEGHVLTSQEATIKVVDSFNKAPQVRLVSFSQTPYKKIESNSKAVLGVKSSSVPKTGVMDNAAVGIFFGLSFVFLGRILKKMRTPLNVTIKKGVLK